MGYLFLLEVMVELNLFASDTFENFAKNFEIKLSDSSPHSPQANGSAEIAFDMKRGYYWLVESM